MEDKKNVQFATIVADGTKPDAEIHCVGFEREDGNGVNLTSSFEGGGRYIAQGITSLVGEFAKTLLMRDSSMAAAAFVCGVQKALADNVSKEVAILAAIIGDKEAGGKLREVLDEIEKEVMADSDEEDSDEEGEE